MSERLAAVLLAMATILAACTTVAEPRGLEPTAVPMPTPTPDASPDATPTSEPSRSPSPAPTPDPSEPEAIELEVTGCPGGVVVDWSPTSDPEFHHYLALRSIEPDVHTAYPPIAPAVDWGDSYATDRFVTAAVDATLIPSDTTLYYRVMGYDLVDRVVAASPVVSTHLFGVDDLGVPEIDPAVAQGRTRIAWDRFGGIAECFSAYHVLVGPAGGVPTTTLTVRSDQDTTELETSGLHSGQTYVVRIEALRTTTLGSLTVGRSQEAFYTVP